MQANVRKRGGLANLAAARLAQGRRSRGTERSERQVGVFRVHKRCSSSGARKIGPRRFIFGYPWIEHFHSCQSAKITHRQRRILHPPAQDGASSLTRGATMRQLLPVRPTGAQAAACLPIPSRGTSTARVTLIARREAVRQRGLAARPNLKRARLRGT